jgi:hypothetical protein
MENRLPKIRLNQDHCEFIEVLTAEGQEALDQDRFFEEAISNCPIDADSHIEKMAFRGTWSSEARRQEAEAFCGEVGQQLFQGYHDRKKWDWPKKRIETSRFGMHGLGLNLAFWHSVPKASLPLLWAGGEVKSHGSTVNWVPLFPNSEM